MNLLDLAYEHTLLPGFYYSALLKHRSLIDIKQIIMHETPQLNFPGSAVQIRQSERGLEIFDVTRFLWISYSPEEWVRQRTIHYLIDYLHVPAGLIAVEMPIQINKMQRRCDLVVYNQTGKPKMIVECKAPTVKISQSTVDQAGRYNLALNAPYLMVTNGIKHFAFQINFENQQTSALHEIPDYNQLSMH